MTKSYFLLFLPPGGANINDYNGNGLTMLHEAVMKQDTQSALFLLKRQADANAKWVASGIMELKTQKLLHRNKM